MYNMCRFDKELNIIGTNKYYKTIYEFNEIVDLSFFTIEEWEHLLEIDNLFEKCRLENNEHKVYCLQKIGLKNGFNKSFLTEIIYGNNIYEIVYIVGKIQPVTVNNLRNYLVKHYHYIKQNYDVILLTSFPYYNLTHNFLTSDWSIIILDPFEL